MTPYDAAMAGVIVAGMAWGAFKGITWQVASLLSLVLGYGMAHSMSGQLAPYFPGEPVIARGEAMVAVYLLTSGGVFLGAWMIRATLRKLQFEAFDRHLGMVLGGVEGCLLGLVVTLFVVSLAPQTRDPIFKSPTGRVVGQVMAALGPVLPEEARGVLSPFWAGSPGATAPEPDAAAPEGLRSLAAEAESVFGSHPAVGSTTAPAGASRDTAAAPASFSELLEQSEKTIGKAVIDGATGSLKRAAKGGDGNGSDGTVERR